MTIIKAKKSLGQNFLIDHEALSDIAHAIQITRRTIIEVWPGYGALTEYIIQQKPSILDLIELDTDMVDILSKRNTEEWWESITIHHQDILKFSPPYESYSVIANIPYYITSPILFHFLYPDLGFHSPQEMVIMMQQEVGEKIMEGRARKAHHSLLSLAMEQACEDIDIVRYVSHKSFNPPPKVDSIILRFTIKNIRDTSIEKKLISLWKVVFAHPRKTLLSNLKWSTYNLDGIKDILTQLGYSEQVRAEAIKKEDWKVILDILT